MEGRTARARSLAPMELTYNALMEPWANIPNWIMTPVHEAVPPSGFSDIASRALLQVPRDVAGDLSHVAQVRFRLRAVLQQADDTTPGRVPDRLRGPSATKADSARLRRPQPRS